MMVERMVRSYNARLGWYVNELWRYPVVEKGGIPPDAHPAAKEDKWFAEPDVILINSQGRKGWKQGYSRDVVANYLRINGPTIVSQIAEDVQGKANLVTGVLKRNPDVFKVVSYETRKAGIGLVKISVWGLVNG